MIAVTKIPLKSSRESSIAKLDNNSTTSMTANSTLHPSSLSLDNRVLSWLREVRTELQAPDSAMETELEHPLLGYSLEGSRLDESWGSGRSPWSSNCLTPPKVSRL